MTPSKLQNIELRQQLQRMTDVPDVAQHPALLREIFQKYPNSITIKESVHPISRYTCLMHALDFVEKPEYIEIATYGLGLAYAGADFAMWLVHSGCLISVSRANAQSGDMVFYFDEDHFKHIGLWDSARCVCSKWGIGHLYEHDLFDVPLSYGSNIRFFARLPYEGSIGHFITFAKSKGVSLEESPT